MEAIKGIDPHVDNVSHRDALAVSQHLQMIAPHTCDFNLVTSILCGLSIGDGHLEMLVILLAVSIHVNFGCHFFEVEEAVRKKEGDNVNEIFFIFFFYFSLDFFLFFLFISPLLLLPFFLFFWMKSVVTANVKKHHKKVQSAWIRNHLDLRPFSAKGKITRDLGVKSFEIVNSGARYSLRIVRVRKGIVYSNSLSEKGMDAATECLAQYSKFEIHHGMFSDRLFAQLVIKTDGVSTTLFSRNVTDEKNTSISGPNHVEASLFAQAKFCHVIESVIPPPVPEPGSPEGTPPEILSHEDDYYWVVGKERWTTNEVAVVDFGDKLQLWAEGVISHPSVLTYLQNLDDFQGYNIYPHNKSAGFSSAGIFLRAKSTFLNVQMWFCLTVGTWVSLFKQYTRPVD